MYELISEGTTHGQPKKARAPASSKIYLNIPISRGESIHRMKASDPKSIAVCEKIISAMGKCQGTKQADLKQRMDDSLGSLNQVQQGLQKAPV